MNVNWESYSRPRSARCSLPALRAKPLPIEKITVWRSWWGVLVPSRPSNHNKSSSVALNISACLTEVPMPWRVWAFMVLSSVNFRSLNAGSFTNLKAKPCVSKWNWIHIIMWYSVLPGKSEPSTFLTSIMNLHRANFKDTAVIVALSSRSHTMSWRPSPCLWEHHLRYILRTHLICFIVSSEKFLWLRSIMSLSGKGSWNVRWAVVLGHVKANSFPSWLSWSVLHSVALQEELKIISSSLTNLVGPMQPAPGANIYILPWLSNWKNWVLSVSALKRQMPPIITKGHFKGRQEPPLNIYIRKHTFSLFVTQPHTSVVIQGNIIYKGAVMFHGHGPVCRSYELLVAHGALPMLLEFIEVLADQLSQVLRVPITISIKNPIWELHACQLNTCHWANIHSIKQYHIAWLQALVFGGNTPLPMVSMANCCVSALCHCF